MIEMKVAAIAFDARSRSPIILLKDATERRALPIYVTQEQAKSIMNVLENQESPRPLTHDLMVNLINVWNLELDKVIINSIEDHTFYAILCTKQGDLEKNIDSRPSDAIAIALRVGCPIWVMEEVLINASIPVDQEADQEEMDAFKSFVADLSPQELIRRAKKNSTE